MPVHNGLHFFEKCIESIWEKTEAPCEIIVVDRGSDDGVNAFCRQHEISFLSFSYKVGYATACNAGIRIATGSELLLLQPDTIVSPFWLTAMLECLRSGEEVGVVSPRETGDSPERSGIEAFCFLFKREVIERTGWLKGDTPEELAEEFGRRVKEHGYSLKVSAEANVRQTAVDAGGKGNG